jgi:hypothetical protein
MKKILFIACLGLIVSCQKETIEPNTSFTGCGDMSKSRTPMSVSDGQEGEGGSTGTGTITDPNSDRDENARRRN